MYLQKGTKNYQLLMKNDIMQLKLKAYLIIDAFETHSWQSQHILRSQNCTNE